MKLWCYLPFRLIFLIQNYAKIILFSGTITLATLSQDCKLSLDLLLFTLCLKACKAVIHLENGCTESWKQYSQTAPRSLCMCPVPLGKNSM